MRDSSEKVRRLRFSVKLIKFLLVSLIVFALVAAAGIAFSIYSFKQYNTLVTENSELKATLTSTNVQLERLKAYEALLKDSEEVVRMQMPMNEEADVNKIVESNQTEEINTQEVVATVFPDAVNATADAPEAEALETASTDTPEGEGMPAAESPAKISNVEIRTRSPKSIRLAFDLNNDNQGVTLTGSVDLALITKDNKVINVSVPSHDMIFQINYYKRMSTAFPLPEGVTPADIQSLRLTVNANGKRLQTETFAFSDSASE